MTGNPSLYQRALGPAFFTLAPELQRFHSVRGRFCSTGSCCVVGPHSWRGRIVGWMLRLPKSTPEGSLAELTAMPGGETWVRRFPSRTMRSQLTMSGGRVVEKLGPVSFNFELQACEGKLLMLLHRVTAFGVLWPRTLMPQLRAEETGVAGRLHFDVAAALPGFGRIVAYRGSLPVPAEG